MFDAHTDYEIRTLNPTYSGEAFGVTFQKGYARVYGLAKDATPEEVSERVYALLEMENAGEGVYTADGEDGKATRIRGKVYQISPWSPETKQRSKEPVSAGV